MIIMDKQAAENRITNTFNYPFDEEIAQNIR